MKRITDVSAQFIGGYIGNVAIKRKVLRYWGTDVIDGIEVFKARKHIYPKNLIDDNIKKLLKVFGSYDHIMKQEMLGITDAWIFLNYNKLGQTSQDYYTKEWIADMLENSMVYDQWYTFYLNFTTRSYGDGWNNNPTLVDSRFKDLSNIEIYNDVRANYTTIYDNHLMQGRSTELLNMEELSKFLLFNDVASDFIIEPIIVSKIPILKTTDDHELGTTYSYIENSISIKYRAKRISQIDENTTLVNKIYTTALQKDIDQIIAESQTYNDDNYNPPPPPPPPGFEVMFYNGQLRVDYYNSLKAKDAVTLLMLLVDSGYNKKKVKWYVKLIIIIIVVIVVYLTKNPKLGYQVGTVLLAIAITFTVISIIAKESGDYALAEWAGGMAQIAFKLYFLWNIFTIVNNGIQAAMASYEDALFEQAWEAGMQEYAKKEGEKYITKSVYSYMFENILESAADIGYSGLTKFTQYTAMVYDHIAKTQLKKIQSESKETAKKSEELAIAQTIANLDEFTMTLNPFQIMDKKNKVIDSIEALYYAKYDGQYDNTRFIFMKLGPFKPIGVFNPSYAEQTSLEMRKRS